MEDRFLPRLANYNTCSGCKACGDVCPKGCISFEMRQDGFWYPQVDSTSCIGCHACQQVCPVITPKAFDNKPLPKAYACWTEKKARHDSASGGVFYAMAEAMIQNGGYVSGAVFDGVKVKHIVTNKIEDLLRIQGTKYFQSDAVGVYGEIKHLIGDGRKVLFGGTSCQVAGLLNIVGDKHDNLITVDLICFGVPSALTIGVEERIRGKKLQRIVSSRDKNHEGGWRDAYYMTCEWNDGTTTVSSPKESFMLGSFCSGKVMRKSCYHCLYKSIYRQSDLTIGDYHCVKGYEEQKSEGISLVFVNSEKGVLELRNNSTLIKHERNISESLPHKRTIYYNDTIYSKRLSRIWLPFLLKHSPTWMLQLLYQPILKSKNPLLWPITFMDILYHLINTYRAKSELKKINLL